MKLQISIPIRRSPKRAPWVRSIWLAWFFSFAYMSVAGAETQPQYDTGAEANLLIRSTKNLLRPITREVLPQKIGVTIGDRALAITDAVYCGGGKDGAWALAQVTLGESSPAAANLQISDCTLPLESVAIRHKNDLGFSGVLAITINWSAWKLQRAVSGAAAATAGTFTDAEFETISEFSDVVSTGNQHITNVDGVDETIAMAFDFKEQAIITGIFKEATQAPSIAWAAGVPEFVDGVDHTVNVELAISHSYLQSLLAKYKSVIKVGMAVNGLQAEISDLAESITAIGNDLIKITISGNLTSSFVPGCILKIGTDWSGRPVTFQRAVVKPDPPQYFCQQLAPIAEKELMQKLSRQQLAFGPIHSFRIFLANRPVLFNLTGIYSNVDTKYLRLFGNGGVDAE